MTRTATATSMNAAAPTEPTKILVVDDLPEKFLVYESILTELGQNLVYAASGAEALKCVLGDEFAVILLDVNMPGMDGFEAASLIRGRRRSAATPIIFLTAFADEMRVSQGYASGAVDYIPTPVVPEVLRAKVRVFVELFQMRRRAALQAEEHAKKVAAEEAARRFAFLAAAGERLNGSLDVDATVRTFAEVAVPEISDLVVVRLDADRGGAAAAAWRGTNGLHLQSNAASLFDALTAAAAPLAGSLAPLGRVTVNVEDLPRLDGGSLLVMPVTTRGGTLGAVAFARAADRPAFPDAETTLARSFVARGAAAVENALLVQTIRDADRRKDEFIATLAHELRNPLAPVRNAVEILGQIQTGDRRVEHCRGVIERQVRQLTRLVDDLLDVSRINSGKIGLRREAVAAAVIVERAVEISRAVLDAAGHELSVTLPDQPLMLDVDPVRMAQVVANLLHNAAKYTPPGGRIEIVVERDGGEAVIGVRDNGVGIPAERLDDIFEMFTQVESVLERAQGGLGVGLCLSRRLVELHGGAITANSGGLGAGSEFTLRLPLAAASSSAPDRFATSPATTLHAGGDLRILVIDDNRDSAESLAMLLRLSGHDARTAFDGRSGLVAAAEALPQVIFLDIGMPGMSGYDVAAALRADARTADATLVAVTGWGQDEDRRRTAAAGFDFHCTKPIAIEDLAAALDRAARRPD